MDIDTIDEVCLQFFLSQILCFSRMQRSFNRTTIFKLIVNGIELHAAFEERENKQQNAKLLLKIRVIFLFP